MVEEESRSYDPCSFSTLQEIEKRSGEIDRLDDEFSLTKSLKNDRKAENDRSNSPR